MSQALRLLALGPTPPPYHGVATFLRDLLARPSGAEGILEHLDTSDRRDASNLGRWDLTNISLGFANLAQLAGACLRRRPQIVYLPLSQNMPAFLRDALFIWQARLMGSQVVVHLHGGYFRTLYEQEGALFGAVARLTLRRTAAVIVLGEAFRGLFAGLVPDDRIHVVENGVPDPGAWPLRRHAPATGKLLYMSTLTRTKGILELLRAVSLLRSAWPAVHLNVAGHWQEDELKSEAQALIAREDLWAQVSFVGNVEGASKARFLAEADLFCLPTRYPYEGQPLVILEALAAGLPVLSSTRGVIGATAPDGLTGRLVAPDASPQVLAHSIDGLLKDHSRLRACGQAARQRYLERYTLERCHARLWEIFKATQRQC